MHSSYLLLAIIALLALIAGQPWLTVLVAVVSVYLMFLDSDAAQRQSHKS